jgi:hypothetical protein
MPMQSASVSHGVQRGVSKVVHTPVPLGGGGGGTGGQKHGPFVRQSTCEPAAQLNRALHCAAPLQFAQAQRPAASHRGIRTAEGLVLHARKQSPSFSHWRRSRRAAQTPRKHLRLKLPGVMQSVSVMHCRRSGSLGWQVPEMLPKGGSAGSQ